MNELRATALAAICTADGHAKCALVRATQWHALAVDASAALHCDTPLPGRCARPRLVAPQRVPQRSLGTREGRGALLHALAHIELNAVNLALDIVWRFAGLPEAFYREWVVVAQEEAVHFEMLCAHLRSLGFEYGDLDAHNGLWEMAEKTRDDVLARLALVARVLEARGLDASPVLRDRLAAAGDANAAAILQRILEDEIGHVRLGTRWFRWLCDQRGLDAAAHQCELARRHDAPRPKGPFNLEARRRAGFSDEEIAGLVHAQRAAR
jgi:uncharacterized ferritin-like protein (DUF455 family)